MRCCFSCGFNYKETVQSWINDYNNIESLSVKLIHAQILFSLIGSLGPLYTGLSLAELSLSLFAFIAIESTSQTLARTYAFLLCFSIVLDIAWFILFSSTIIFNDDGNGDDDDDYVMFLSKLTLTMQVFGFVVRLFSSLLWIQMYRLGVSNLIARETDTFLRNSFLSPSVVRRSDGSGDIYDPLRYSTLVEDGNYLNGGCNNHGISITDPVSASETSHLNSPLGRTRHAKDDENALGNLQSV